MSRLFTVFFVFVLVMNGRGYAQSTSVMLFAEPDTMLSIVRQHGDAVLGTDSADDPYIGGNIDGRYYTITFYGCEENQDCRMVILTSEWKNTDVSLQQINDWNRRSLFGRYYLDDNQNLYAELTVNFDYGVTADNFYDDFNQFQIMIEDVQEELSF